MLFTYFMLGGLILLFLPNQTGKLQLAFASVFRWPLSVGRNFELKASTEQSLGDMVPRREYEKLENAYNNLKATRNKERQRFVDLYGLHNNFVWEGADFALAKVITVGVKGAGNEMTIDYSRDAPLVAGQFVLGRNSIIGRIADVSGGTANVRLFTDRDSAIPVKIGGLDVKMMMKGNGDNSARILQVPTKHLIKDGDDVFARDTRNRFLDAPVIIGKVAQCVKSRRDPLIWDITVEPACDIKNLDDVAIIIMDRQQ